MTVDLLARLPELEREAEGHEQKARALRQIIEGVRTLNGEAARLFGSANGNAPLHVDAPRGREAVRRIVAQRPGVWRVRDIKREVKLRGWPSSPTAIETAVKRLQEGGEAEWISKGVYQFPPNGGSNGNGTLEVTE